MSEQNLILKGIPASPGIVLGRARVLSDLADFKPSYRLVYAEEDKAAELESFERAIDQAHEDLTRLKEKLEAEFPEHTHLLDLHLLILKDQMLYDEPLRFIKEGNLNAEWALYRSFERVRELFSRIEDPYIKGRIQDVESVYRRLLGNLSGKDPAARARVPARRGPAAGRGSRSSSSRRSRCAARSIFFRRGRRATAS